MEGFQHEESSDEFDTRSSYVQAVADDLEFAGLDPTKAEQVLSGIEQKTQFRLVYREEGE